MHSKEFSGNQGKHQNFDPSILPFELIWTDFDENEAKKWLTQKN
jgi:hypothetical protein